MNTIKLLRNLSTRFPKSIKHFGDHVGLMTGKLPTNVNNILLCLDFDDIVFDQIKNLKVKPDLIITHHPFIYGTKYQVFKRDLNKKLLCEKIDNINIPVYSMHTNFDTGRDGMNDALAEALHLNNITPLQSNKMARGGELANEMDIHEFARYANECFNIEYSHLVFAGKNIIKKVAIVGGGGSYSYRNAYAEGYDIFISGDTPHHIRREVIANKFNYLDVSHEVEKIFMPQMKKLLLEIDKNLHIEIIDHEQLPELITK